MFLLKPSYEILRADTTPLTLIELAGRTCYKSEDRMEEGTEIEFCKKILNRGHESVIEHANATVRFVVDRGVSHELVRHRLCSFSQESTRYCNYGGGVTFVIPPWVELAPGEYRYEDDNRNGLTPPGWIWLEHVLECEKVYQSLLQSKWTPQQARSVLPNSLKTEIVVTANFREWRHIFSLRASRAAHPQMREIMTPLLLEFASRWPVLFLGIIDEVANGKSVT